MNLAGLLALVESTPEFGRLADELKDQSRRERAAVAFDPAVPALVAALGSKLGRPVLLLTASPERARKLFDQLRCWSPPETPVMLFPEPDVLPYERLAGDQAAAWDRLRLLSRLLEGPASLVVASAAAAASRTVARADFAATAHSLAPDMTLDVEAMLRRWLAMGYQPEEQVEVPGAFSRRGGIIDVYSPASDSPVRVELLGNQVDSLRAFDPETQRSLKRVVGVRIIPAREMLLPSPETGIDGRARAALDSLLAGLSSGAGLTAEARLRLQDDLSRLAAGATWFEGADFYAPVLDTGSLLEYVRPYTLVVLEDPEAIGAAMASLDRQCRERLLEKVSAGELPQAFPPPYVSSAELEARLKATFQSLGLWPWEGHGEGALVLPFAPAPSFGGNLGMFLDRALRSRQEKGRLVVVTQQASRLSELLSERDMLAALHAAVEATPQPGTVTLVQGSIAQGWAIRDELTVLGDLEVFGSAKEKRERLNRPVRRQLLRSEIAPGDYVVHIDHGIARFSGTILMRREGAEKEYLVLEYAEGDRLYVPVDHLDRVSRYLGAGGAPPVLNRLRTQDWARAKQRVQKAVADIAAELLSLYAWREVASGLSFPQDPAWQRQLEEAFPYVETPDQSQAVDAVKHDMEKPRPMDRLVCGDVGYGKTEVALRAAFKAALGGKQVAVLVPTTVLAQQHYNTFSERLKPFPVRVELLSRFRNDREQGEVLKGLASGAVDICIGTHRLLQKDVAFKDLGLVVIDEEQRFGVMHKERLKQMRREVDVLTLSATPIPRTLHMALAGVRDVSLIETPPEERLPVKTLVGEWDMKAVCEAVRRELGRNGQVFLVHNRVQSIYSLAAELREALPGARAVVAHGQMHEDELERVMSEFLAGQHDVLVCTTIIESGLDIPRVNTLIVKDAHKMGLTQLYQLRGRVGRGSVRAHAYFLYPRGQELTQQARERLSTIARASELGAGFHIAMKDLEIRGAGNLLGSEQSGHIAAVGFELYSRMLEQAVEEMKAQQAGAGTGLPRANSGGPAVDLPFSGRLPEDYVSDPGSRIAAYRRLVSADDECAIAEVEADLRDRFGPLPDEARDLLYAARVRLLASQAGVECITTEERDIVLRVAETRLPRLQLLAAVHRGGVRARGNQLRLDTVALAGRWRDLLPEILARLAR